MSYTQANMTPVIQASEEVRTTFLVKVYQHLALAVAAFMGFEYLLFVTGVADTINNFIIKSGGAGWLLILGAFSIVGMISSKSAHSIGNPKIQYAALFGLAAAEALIFVPLLKYAFGTGQDSDVWLAAVVTGIGFAALSVVAFTTRKDLSFLRPLIMWGSIIAIGLIIAATLFSFNLGAVFSIAMVGLAGASILYQTQKIVRVYPEWAYVGAAVGLFGSLMTMFWYILSLFLDR